MKLTVEDIARMTGLEEGTIRTRAWKMKLGKREGRRLYFSKAEAKIINNPSGNVQRKSSIRKRKQHWV
jgi:hypothetical protein